MKPEGCVTDKNGTGRLRARSLIVVAIFLSLVMASAATTQKNVPAKPSSTTASEHASKDEEPEVNDDATAPSEVIVEGRRILTVYQPIGTYTPKERAERIAERIIAVAREGKMSPELIGLQPREAWTEITANDKVLMAVTDVDAKMAKKTRDQLAAEDAGSIRQALLNYRREHSWNSILKGILYTVLLTSLLAPIAWTLRKLRLAARARLEKWIHARTRAEEKKSPWQIAFTYTISLAVACGTVMRWLLMVALVQAYFTITLSFFSTTRSISIAITDWLFSTLKSLADSGLEYLPNLVVIAIIAAIASQVLRLITMVFDEISKGNLTVRGFYPDWAEPTAKLIRILVLVLVIVVIFPYLPGSKSLAFQGISIFVGVLLSLGSSSAVANAIAGIILTYMRSFLVGDWVKIGDTIGEVVEKNILVTRILTPKQEIITIPNATVMNGSVMNYTREAKNAGVIFHTTVTIGYDAPWKTVHLLLMDAAYATKHVLSRPEPFVLQTALNDFYVAYELNAYTDTPRQMQFIYSDLHQNIQDKFNEAGMEICSPHFSSLRDGNTVAIPQQYISPDYSAPGFRVDAVERSKAQIAGKQSG
jgi:small-conductance mechanosensitive channel